jgi:NAD(P)-dependent dehydrogenase (short-subunit alcohol dehydrogenase family)
MKAAPAALFSLDSQVALVTGGGGALGSLIATTLAGAGAHVVLTGRTRKTLERTAARVHAAGGKAICITMDVTHEESIAEALAAVERDTGVPTIVVNNAGTNRPKPALKTSATDWDLVHDTNLRGCFLVARECAQRLRSRQLQGSIINVASTLAIRGQKTTAAYMAAKAGLVHLTHALALEWADFGVRVNAILPGYFESDLTTEFLGSETGQQLVQRIPMKRIAGQAELAGPLLLLASAASAYMTGAALVVDGGLAVNAT